MQKKGRTINLYISLTVGIERISKLCLLLDYYIENNGEFPNNKFLKKIGHDINKLHTKSIDIKEKHSFQFQFLDNLNEIHISILDILSSFATNNRL